jgi:protein-tyrosine phosphatase
LVDSIPFVDIHCHLLPGIDDGAPDWATTRAMAELAVAEGTHTIVVTPHQLGGYRHVDAATIRRLTAELQAQLDRWGVRLQVLPGADVRIEDDLVEAIRNDNVATLGDHRRHVLLELPHELCFPLEGLLEQLQREGVTGILSHPERNAGLRSQPRLIERLVDAGCLMQVTAGSLLGGFGAAAEELAQWMLARGLVHIVATDAHSARRRRPQMLPAYREVAALAGADVARLVCATHPQCVASGQSVAAERLPGTSRSSFSWRNLWRRSRVA